MNAIKTPDFISDYAMSGTRPLEVVVIGAGGTGSSLMGKLFLLHNTLIQLTGLGLRVTLIDDDTVAKSNLGRQSFYDFDLGYLKSQCLIERFNRFSNGMNWSYKSERYSFKDSDVKFSNKVVFGCVDNVEARKNIHHGFKASQNCIYIDCGNDAHSANIIMAINAKTGDKKVYIPSVFDLYSAQFSVHKDTNVDSCSASDAINKQDFGINDLAANHASQMLWQLIRHGKVDYQGTTVDLRTGISAPILADAETWSMYGYTRH